ncbi:MULTISPECIES: DNA methyltransferase [unclassified Haladaptatus]|uniref:DNA methyltransferase n=1 Tax=unclassified Haladaptatus TaxID=2622732 RepID=UPI00209C297C|nr:MULTISPECIES: DNA methyltransferase [unclassified Haladaptatus]MCO8245864.1 DNA methyltransferase [Haladaptatus sp. AB643]MCO8254562.1 DNA methyltransferase [Haladaptatus sp. AB618]
MQTFLRLQYEKSDEFPSEFGHDIRTPESFVEEFITEFSDEGDTVLDPFAGFGTTMKVAEELGRVPYGIEYEEDRVTFIRDRIEHEDNVVNGTVFDLPDYGLPTFDLCLTSPPYMAEEGETNPFQNYTGESSYEEYLADFRRAFATVKQYLVDDAPVLVDISNLKNDGNVTTLVWDAGGILSEQFHFEGEIVVGWETDDSEERDGNYDYGYDHNYCLVFRNDD